HINVCITKEYMISQICLYCFSKPDDPIQRKDDKDKQVSFKSKGSPMPTKHPNLEAFSLSLL
ncbi:hypothetical protein BCV72DRAFT_210628, partial [Rhizopus microsporus var. microsporus]